MEFCDVVNFALGILIFFFLMQYFEPCLQAHLTYTCWSVTQGRTLYVELARDLLRELNVAVLARKDIEVKLFTINMTVII